MTLEPVGRSLPRWVDLLGPTRQLAEILAKTEFVPKAFRDRPDSITAAILYGDELGVEGMMALQSIDVVEGKPRPSAHLARALILAAGHSLIVHEMTGQRCRMSALRKGRPEAERLRLEWTIDQARAAGLTNKPNWRSYPRAMLAARCTSDLANLVFPDVMKGLTWVSEEPERLAEVDTWQATDVSGLEEAPPKDPPRRRTRPRSLPSPGHTLATEDRPGPDGSVDVPLVDAPVAPDPRPARGLEDVDLPPETPEPGSEPEAPPRPITNGQQKILQTLLSVCLGTSSTPEERHQVLGMILGREVDTATTLTASEADRACDVLRMVDRGELALDLQEDGTWVLEGGAPEPDPPWEPGPEPGETDPWATP